MTNILGISAFYHDSAAALVRDGEIVAAAQEERFTRRKHDPGFPSSAIEYCLAEGGIRRSAVDYVVFYEKPIVKFERLLGHVSHLRAGGVRVVPGGDAVMGGAQARPGFTDSAGAGSRVPR